MGGGGRVEQWTPLLKPTLLARYLIRKDTVPVYLVHLSIGIFMSGFVLNL